MKFNTLNDSDSECMRWRKEERENIDESSNFIQMNVIISVSMCMSLSPIFVLYTIHTIYLSYMNPWDLVGPKTTPNMWCVCCVRDFIYRQPVSRTLTAILLLLFFMELSVRFTYIIIIIFENTNGIWTRMRRFTVIAKNRRSNFIALLFHVISLHFTQDRKKWNGTRFIPTKYENADEKNFSIS